MLSIQFYKSWQMHTAEQLPFWSIAHNHDWRGRGGILIVDPFPTHSRDPLALDFTGFTLLGLQITRTIQRPVLHTCLLCFFISFLSILAVRAMLRQTQVRWNLAWG